MIWGGPPLFLIGNPYNEYINTYYKVDDHPLTQEKNGSLVPVVPVRKIRL